MIKFINTFSIITFILFSTICHSQDQDGLGWYTAQIDSNELYIHLMPDSTYEARSLGGISYGYYEIITLNSIPSPYDLIIFGDKFFDTKNAFYFYHVSIPQEVVKSLVDSNLYSEDSLYVAMLDFNGEFVTYYNVCFNDSTEERLFCDYNEGNKKAHSIPMGTSSIGMTGEQFNRASCFESEYNRTQGSIAYVIGPSLDRFYIKKDRSCILYRPCYCDDYDSDCCVVYMRR